MAKCTTPFLMNADLLFLLIKGEGSSKMVCCTHRILNDDTLTINDFMRGYLDELCLSVRTRRPPFFIYDLCSLQAITLQAG